MDSISALAVAVAVFTATVMIFGKRSNTLCYIAGVLVVYVLSTLGTGGNMQVVYNDLIWNGDFGQPWRLFTCIWVPLNPISLAFNLVCFFLVGVMLDRRTTNVTYSIIIFGGAFFGLTQWSGFNGGDIAGTSLAIASVVGAALASFTRIRIMLPKIGDTRLEVWNVCVLWIVVVIIMNYIYYRDMFVVASLAHIVVMLFGALFALALDSDRVKSLFSTLKADKHVDISGLEELCVTESQKNTYRQMEDLDDPYLIDLWAGAFVKKLTCPKCGKRYAVVNGRVVCQNGHFLKH